MTVLLAALAVAVPALDASPVTTSYCQTGRMADGTQTRLRSAASNSLPLGTRIRITSRQAGPGGLRRYVIRDRIGWGSQLDLWSPTCAAAIRFGRHFDVRIRRGWR